jgi:predicted lipoprotein with Yx(FWY)xxD motif
LSARATGPVAAVVAMIAVAVIATVVLAGCGSHAAATAATAPVSGEPTLQVENEPGFGPLVTDPSGSPLYLYTRDERGRPRCTGACSHDWVPLVVPDGATAQAGVGVDTKLIGTVARPGGGRQITYARWPVYTYLGDKTTFSVNGAGRHIGGGTFLALTPSGRPARRD